MKKENNFQLSCVPLCLSCHYGSNCVLFAASGSGELALGSQTTLAFSASENINLKPKMTFLISEK